MCDTTNVITFTYRRATSMESWVMQAFDQVKDDEDNERGFATKRDDGARVERHDYIVVDSEEKFFTTFDTEEEAQACIGKIHAVRAQDFENYEATLNFYGFRGFFNIYKTIADV